MKEFSHDSNGRPAARAPRPPRAGGARRATRDTLPQAPDRATGTPTRPPGQIVLVLQGGGALGAYQVGVYQAMHETGIEPDWVIGTSIGAINASIIAGNAPERRLERLREFWESVEWHEPFGFASALPWWVATPYSNLQTILSGVPGFFAPNPKSWLGLKAQLGVEAASFYDTHALRGTLARLVDFELVNRCVTRLTVGAVNARTGAMRYFDSRDLALAPEHVMASGALPPAFPAIRIDGEPYWDGGVYSNTPIEAVLDDNPRRSSTVFSVHLWNPSGNEPQSIWDVLGRQKEIQYSSRAVNHVNRQKQIHRLRHVISQLAQHLPPGSHESEEVRELLSWGCHTTVHIVRLLAPRLEGEDHTKDIDFTPGGIHKRWEAGYTDTKDAIARAPWHCEINPLDGVLLHEHESMHAAM
jgi:NTE family protein